MAEVHDIATLRSARRQDELLERLGRYIADGESDPSVLGLEGIEKNQLLGMRWHVQQFMAAVRPTPPAVVHLYEAIDDAVQAEIKRLTDLWRK